MTEEKGKALQAFPPERVAASAADADHRRRPWRHWPGEPIAAAAAGWANPPASPTFAVR